MIFFKDLVYVPKYPILIFVWLILLCLVASYLVNLICKPIINLLDKSLETIEQKRIGLSKSFTVK